MKILIDLTSIYDHLTGIERFAANITSNMITQYPEDEYILLFKNEIHKDFIAITAQTNVTYRILRCGNKLIFNQLVLPMALYRQEADVYFFPAFCSPWLFWSRKTVNAIHDMSDFECWQGKSYLKVLYCRLGMIHAKHASKSIVTVSEFSRKRISQILKIPSERIAVVYNGVSDQFHRKEDADESQIKLIKRKYGLPEKYLLSLCTIEPRKNLSLLIEAFRNINDQSKLGLVLCGRAGWNLKESLGDPDGDWSRITTTGFVDDEDLPLIYGNAELFIFPSKYEGFGIPPLEAMSAGCPVVSSDAASMPEVLGEAAMYFENGSCESLEEVLQNALAMGRMERSEMIDRGMQQSKKYRWENESAVLHRVLTGR